MTERIPDCPRTAHVVSLAPDGRYRCAGCGRQVALAYAVVHVAAAQWTHPNVPARPGPSTALVEAR